jgi:hypothetical protein
LWGVPTPIPTPFGGRLASFTPTTGYPSVDHYQNGCIARAVQNGLHPFDHRLLQPGLYVRSFFTSHSTTASSWHTSTGMASGQPSLRSYSRACTFSKCANQRSAKSAKRVLCGLLALLAPCHFRVSSHQCAGYLQSITCCFVLPESSRRWHLPETLREFDLILQERQAVCFSRAHLLADL